MLYEELKHSGEIEIVGVNMFLADTGNEATVSAENLIRSSDEEKRERLDSLAGFHDRWQGEVGSALSDLQAAARRGDNLFDVLLETVKVASLGQISEALFEVGGRFRRAI